jgi:DNA-binding NarL/FixJ family response regulator
MTFARSALTDRKSDAASRFESCTAASACTSSEQADAAISNGMDFAGIGSLPGPTAMERMTVVVIGDRSLFRDCLAQCLTARNYLTASFTCVSEWQKAVGNHSAPSVAVLCSRANDAKEIKEELSLLARTRVDVPVVLLSEAGDIDEVLVALDSGVRGYIQSSVTLDIVAEALRLVGAGGTFVATGTRSSPSSLSVPVSAETGASVFTGRELAVLAALQQGKANKRIAYDLNMSESTVKAHVRNIMRKLKAKSRTEVAFLTRKMFPFAQDGP